MRETILIVVALLMVGLSMAVGQEPVRMFLPVHEADNLARPKLLVDASGGIHIVSSSITGYGFVYGYCEPGCTGPEQMSEVRFDTESNGPILAMDLDPQGRPHVVVGDFMHLRYAHCSGDCRTETGWNYGQLASFDQSDWTISGDTLAIGPDGRSHFFMHGDSVLFTDGVHTTWYYSCAADCHLAGNWSGALIEPEQNYTHASLHARGDGALLAGVVAAVNYDLGMENPVIAYLQCLRDCHLADSWVGIGLFDAFDAFWSQDIPPAVSMELIGAGNPRIAFLGNDDNNDPLLVYMECNQADCTGDDSWGGVVLLDTAEYSIGAGVHLQADAAGGLYLSSTVGSGIVNWYCMPGADCTDGTAWELSIVESSDDIEPDDIFLYTNCVIGAWFLSDPQLGVLPDGRTATVYAAEDYSFGGAAVDTTRPACPVGMDMSLGRLTIQSH